MKWTRQLRWKLFMSHLVIVVIADVVLLGTASFMARFGLATTAPLTLGDAAAETGQLDPAAGIAGTFLEQFNVVVQQALLVSGFAALAAAVVVSLFVSQRIVEPLQLLSAVSRRMANGFYRERTTIASDDEIAELSHSVNQLADALDRTEQRRLALLTDVTHELRTPLATIGGYMEGLIDGVIQPDRENFALVLRETGRLQRLIEDLELLSRVEAGQLPIVARSLDLHALLEQMLVQFQPTFAAQEIDLRLDAQPLPACWADPDRVNQVLINLIANAFRYTPRGGSVTLSVLALEEHLLIALKDTGIGIASEHLPHIFERFYRVDKSRARHSGGNGVGLAIARHLVYAQGGELWATSDGPGLGATFYFTLPYAPPLPETAFTAEQTIAAATIVPDIITRGTVIREALSITYHTSRITHQPCGSTSFSS
ncbi:HAMP domain-containing protein [Candidatus Gracilibacteria bacterium]|nr:HAMP domain-containing protein [Candidatus Gracilibacteria bacterium]